MSADKSGPLATITIELDGKAHELVPSLRACMAISEMSGGIDRTIARLIDSDFNAFCDVIAHGMSLNPGQRQRMLPEAVFKTGMLALKAPCIQFCEIVQNGGRALPEEGDDDAGPLGSESPSGNSTDN